MAHSLSAQKRVRTSERRRLYNRSHKSAFKTAISKFEASLNSGKLDEATALYSNAASLLDRAAKNGIIHPNKAARKKSRLAHRLAKAQ
jgi:small subunit ribosomal protein S20